MHADCVFCKIVRGALPSTRIYEDRLSLAFMDIAPIVKGHTLVIPRDHYELITAVPEPLLQHLIVVARRVAAAQTAGLRADGVNIIQANGAAAGQVVPHVHFHVIPRYNDDGHHWNWKPTPYANPGEMHTLAEKLRKGLN